MVIHPKGAFPIDLSKVIEIKLTDQTLETRMAKVLGKRFRLESREVRDAKGFTRGYPLRALSMSDENKIICKSTMESKEQKGT